MSRAAILSNFEEAKKLEEKLKSGWKQKLLLLKDGDGKVFVSENSKLSPLDGIKFFNLDINFYDKSRNLLPFMEKFHRSKWFLKFTLATTNQFGKEDNFEAMLLSPLAVGEIGSFDWRGISDSQKFEAEFGIECGVFSGHDDPYIKQCLAGAASIATAYSFPGKHLQEAKPFIMVLIFGLYLDNILDNDEILNRKFTFGEISQINEKLMEVLLGKKHPDEQKVDFEFPYLKCLCLCLSKIREAALTIAAAPEMRDRFFQGMKQYLDAVAFNTCIEWEKHKKTSKTGVHKRAHFDIRLPDSALPAILRMQALNYGNKLSSHIYDSYLYNYLFRLCMKHAVIVNEIFSFKKEFNSNESCNYVIIRHQEEGMGLLQAMESCIEEANLIAGDISDLGDLLLKLHNNDKELQNAIFLLKSFLLGHIVFYKYAFRYRHDIVYDAIFDGGDWLEKAFI